MYWVNNSSNIKLTPRQKHLRNRWLYFFKTFLMNKEIFQKLSWQLLKKKFCFTFLRHFSFILCLRKRYLATYVKKRLYMVVHVLAISWISSYSIVNVDRRYFANGITIACLHTKRRSYNWNILIHPTQVRRIALSMKQPCEISNACGILLVKW